MHGAGATPHFARGRPPDGMEPGRNLEEVGGVGGTGTGTVPARRRHTSQVPVYLSHFPAGQLHIPFPSANSHGFMHRRHHLETALQARDIATRQRSSAGQPRLENALDSPGHATAESPGCLIPRRTRSRHHPLPVRAASWLTLMPPMPPFADRYDSAACLYLLCCNPTPS